MSVWRILLNKFYLLISGKSKKKRSVIKSTKNQESFSESDSDYTGASPRKGGKKVVDDGNQESYIKRIKYILYSLLFVI